MTSATGSAPPPQPPSPPNRGDAIRAHERADTFFNDTNKAVIEAGQVAMRNLMLVTGGSAVAKMTLIAGLTGQGKMRAD